METKVRTVLLKGLLGARKEISAFHRCRDSPESTLPGTVGSGRRGCGLIARLKEQDRLQVPITELSELRTESDVEQKLVYPFLVHTSFMGIPQQWVRTKE